MSTTTTLDVGYQTHPGQVRERNEDHYGVPPPDLSAEVLAAKGRLYLVADGMGGHKGGQLASQMAVQHVVHEYYQDPSTDPRQSLGRAIRMANAAIFRQSGSSPELAKMGTTVTAIVVRGHDLYVANVGDSRTYLVRRGALQQITEDHSFIAQGLKDGTITPEQATSHPYRGVITRALGAQPDVQPDFYHRPLQPGDLLLLCSDGLTNEVDLAQVTATMTHAKRAQAAADHLVEQAVQNGGRDNVTVVVVGVNGYRPAATAAGLPPWLLPAAAGVLALALVVAVLGIGWISGSRVTPTDVAQVSATESTAILLSSVTAVPPAGGTEAAGQLSSPSASPEASPETCGNGACDADENPETCPGDCTPPAPSETATEEGPVPAETEATEPTATRTPKPPATTTPKPSATPTLLPAPELIKPQSGESIQAPNIRLEWDWDGELGENDYFDVRVWLEGEPGHSGIAWSEEEEWQIDPREWPVGKYFWSIAVIRGRDGKVERVLSKESQVWEFDWAGVPPTKAPSTDEPEPTQPPPTNPPPTNPPPSNNDPPGPGGGGDS